MSAVLARVSFRTESGVAEDKPWASVDSALPCGHVVTVRRI
jgi:hypothetical protein